ncbi:MAG: hypothetical protein ACHQX3_08275, partial [Nitrospirales bacterium]
MLGEPRRSRGEEIAAVECAAWRYQSIGFILDIFVDGSMRVFRRLIRWHQKQRTLAGTDGPVFVSQFQ